MAGIVALPRSWGAVKPPIGTPVNPSSPLARGLWHNVVFNEGSGVPYDLAPGATAPTATGSTPWAATQGGAGVYCSGGASVNLPDRGNLAAGDFAIRVVFRPRSWTGGFTTIFSKPQTSAIRELAIFANTSGNLSYQHFGNLTPGSISIPTAMTAGRVWDFTVSRAGSTVTAYVNGTARGTFTAAGTSGIAYPLMLGYDTASGGGSPADADYLLFQAWRGRSLSAGEVASLYADPYAIFTPQPRRYFQNGSSPTYSGSGTPSLSNLSASASASYAQPIYSGSASPSLSNLSVASSASYAAPTYSGSGTPSLGSLTPSASASYTPPAYSGSGSPTIGNLSATASASYATPTYAATGSPSLSNLSASAVASYLAPIISGTGSPSLSALSLASVASYAAPGAVVGSGGVSLSNLSASASASYTPPAYSGSGTASVSPFISSATASYVAPVFSGSASASVSPLAVASVASYSVPAYSGSGSPAISALTSVATATYTVVGGAIIGSGSPAMGRLTVVATATYADAVVIPPYAGQGSAFALSMFPDRCTITPLKEAPGRDPSGARIDLFDTPTEGVPCFVQGVTTADDAAVANALGAKAYKKVYFRTSPGFLRTGSLILVTSRHGDPDATQLSVIKVERDGLMDLNLWRADCNGRA